MRYAHGEKDKYFKVRVLKVAPKRRVEPFLLLAATFSGSG